MAEPNVDALADKYGGGSNNAPATNIDIDALATKYGSSAPSTPQPTVPEQPVKQIPKGSGVTGLIQQYPGLAPGMAKGVVNVGNTLSLGQAYITEGIDRLFKNPKIDRVGIKQQQIENVNKLYKERYGDLPGSGMGEVAGEVAASAPFIPGATIATGMKTAFGAMPTILATGEKVAAPLVNRLSAAMGTGTVAGGQFGALTSAGTEEPFAEHVGKNIVAGAVGGPVVEGGAALASKVSPFVRKVLNNMAINVAASRYGMAPWAVKNILTELENTGHSVAEARLVLQKLGPQATLADLDASLQKEVGALSQRGGRSTSIVENRYAERAKTANDEAQKIMDRNLGPRPDVILERNKILGADAEAIQKEAQRLTKADYEAAKRNPISLNLQSVVTDIDTALNGAVGKEASALKEVKGYLYKNDAQGNPIIKTSAADLHKVRKGIDDIIDDRANSLPPNALNAIKDVRAAVDKHLKSIPEMAAADAKYAEKMSLKEGLRTGYEALNDGNYQTFEKMFNAASPDLKATIRKGLHAAIADKMQSAAKGELAGAQQLFKAKTDAREKLKLAFGQAGEEVLDALAKQATFRATEAMVATGSRTALNQRINAKYDAGTHAPGPFSEAVKGMGGDIIAGTPGAVAAVMGARRAGGNIMNRMRQKRLDLNAETSADVLSRSGQDLDNALNVLETVRVVQGKIKGNPKQLRLPAVLSAPVGEPILEKLKEGGSYGKKLIKHGYNLLPDL